MIKTIIIDDEQAAVEITKFLCQRYDKNIDVCGTANTINDGIALIKKHNPQLVVLDIEFPEGLGFEVLRQFPDLNFHTVFITAFEGYALEAIKFHALDYILKPIDHEEFRDMLHYVAKSLQEKTTDNHTKVQEFLQLGISKKIGIPDTFGMRYIEANEIIRIQADGPYSEVTLLNGKKHVVSRILKNFETALSPLGFIRTHRTHLVNLEHIQSFSRSEGGFLLLSNNDKVPIARKEREAIFQLLSNRTFNI